MLDRFSGIDEEGNFEVKGDLRILYSIMMNIRSTIIYDVAKGLMQALKIAVRYSVCRRQFSTQVGSKSERKILDYQSQMYKLGPLVADGFLMQAVGRFIRKMCLQVE